ncbi:MAG: cation-translocating P-type ATPase [Deltaproteobacteria bacterium]|nr:cation-translocating P-type ATPase [Deltaproteobacteria bacterium]
MATAPSSTSASADQSPVWHALSVAEVAARLQVDVGSGLSGDEAGRRALVHGPNEIPEQHRRSPYRMLLGQFTDFMILVLIGAAIISGAIGDAGDTLAIVIIVLLNGLVGFVQEYRAERAVAALKRLASATATVRRDGKVLVLPAAQLVPGDVVLLEAGNLLPADLRLVETVQLKVDESALTGESAPVEKCTEALAALGLPLGDRRNLAYKGTVVSYGRGAGVVVATAAQSELGKIADLLRGADEHKTPLQKRLARFGRQLALAVIAVCALVFLVGVLRGEPVVLMFLTAVSLAVAAIPEALPAVVTVSLALGARTMVQKQALIRRLPAVETLGSVTFICSDKTGTLTQNRMRVEEFYAGGQVWAASPAPADGAEPWPALYRALALSNDARVASDGSVSGDPTEVALYLAAARAGYDKATQERLAPRLAELPFDSERKCMTTFHRAGGAVVSFTKGAPEMLLGHCGSVLSPGGVVALATATMLAQAERMAATGLRVLAVAWRHWPELPAELSPPAVERELSLLALVGVMDPPRPEAAAAVALCRSAGITPVMITGDHAATARSIAVRLGIIADGDAVMTGPELERLSMVEFERSVERIRVYARVAPEQKLKIVRALQDQGEFVAMTGDGVNDAPALQRADIGVAMGLSGTDVAREAAHIILLDDNFATIVSAVREGRRIFDNIRKFIKYAMTGNAGEIWTIFLAPFLGLPIPLLPIHILWINLVTDGLPGLALAAEPEEREVMQRPPRSPQQSIFAQGMWQHIIWVGLLMGGVCLLTQAWAYHTGSAHWQTMVFTVLTLSQLGHALAIRSYKESLPRLGLWSNRPLLGAVVLTFALQLATIYLPPLNPVFKTTPLSAGELGLSLLLAAVVLVAVEVEKWLVRRGWIYRELG